MMRRVLVVVIVSVLGFACQVSAATLGIFGDGRYFTIDRKPVFLLGISYYGATSVSTPELLREDLSDMKKAGFNWIRVWATWKPGDENLSVVTPDGVVREPYMSRLKSLIRLCNERRIVVDVTMARGDDGFPSNQAQHMACARTLAKELLPYRNVYFDVGNERHIGDSRFVSLSEVGAIIQTIKRIDPKRLCTASGVPSTAGSLKEYLTIGRCDFIAPHLSREPDSPRKTPETVKQFITWMEEIHQRVPIHLQEPFRRGYNNYQPSADDFIMDCKGAKTAGAAGWCLHNGQGLGPSGGTVWRSFMMKDQNGRLFEQLDPVEMEVTRRVLKEIGGRGD